MIRFEVRQHRSWWLTPIILLLALNIALLLSALLIWWAGRSPLAAIFALLDGAFGSKFALSETLTRAIPLLLTGLAAAVAFRARFWNIGAEGQFYCGALAATCLGTGIVELPPVLMIPFLLIAGAAAGALVLLPSLLLKNYLRVDEVVTTLLMNFIILLFVNYLLEGPIKDPMSLGWPQAAPIIEAGLLPKLVDKTRLHAGLLIGIACAIVLFFMIRFTRLGFAIRAVGINRDAAEFAGLRISRVMLAVALLSGGMAGIAGVSEVAGLKGYLTLDLSPGFGYAGIVVATLAHLHPLAVIGSAIFLAAVYVGADAMSRTINISNYIADVIVALSMLAVFVGMLWTQFIVRWER